MRSLAGVLLLLAVAVAGAAAFTDDFDETVMQVVAASLGPAGLAPLHWSNGTSPCEHWVGVTCDTNGRVVAVSAPRAGFNGTLPREAHKLPTLQLLDVRDNNINGPVPVAPFPELRRLHIDSNNFSSVPPGFLFFFPALEVLTMNNNSQSQPWMLRGAAPNLPNLRVLQASNASITGTLSLFLGNSTGFLKLAQLSLADNTLTGPVPATFVSETLRYLDLSNNKLTGSIEFLTNFINIKGVRLDGNAFTGRLPDFSKLPKLRYLSVAQNQFTGYVPASLGELTGLKAVYLAGGNVFLGPMPQFGPSVQTDVLDAASQGSFCRPEPGPCQESVTQLLSVAAGFKFPAMLVASWKGNDPCSGWLGVHCDTSGAVTGVNLCRLGLNGTLDPAIGNLSSLQAVLLSDNYIAGVVPASITSLASLRVFDISDNAFAGTMPRLRKDVVVWAQGNPGLQVPTASSSPPDTRPTAGKLVFVVAALILLNNI